MSNRYAIILCGGSGTRLWPLSRSLKPKQLLQLNGDLTLLQQTAQRICKRIDPANLVTVTHKHHYFEVKGQLSEGFAAALPGVIEEPVAKNTLPAIAIAVKRIMQTDPTALIGVFASDHAIDNEQAFYDAWASAEQAAEQGYLALLGIKPTEPATGYGYIKPTQTLGIANTAMPVLGVAAFVEKPDTETATQYLADGYLWNSGMFVFRADVFMAQLAHYQPAISQQIHALDLNQLAQGYDALPSISMDVGLAEKSDNIAVVPVDMAWSDLGNWESIYQRQTKNTQQNVMKGNVIATDTQNSLLWADSGVIATLGVDHLFVVKTADVTMICDRNRAEDVKQIVEQVQARYPSMTETHLTVQRPWGAYTVLEEGAYFKIKSIMVNPHSKLSLQSHQHRSEHWIVVSGAATVTNGENTYTVATNESTYIPAGNQHRLENKENQALIIIEVQTGGYLQEDDIIRYDDAYGRS
jgi:mannose-1-phosphate guanylyltransferase / mannose-6-phosphate isomerase